jgi:D-lyxose ketol-isomerase
MTDISRRQMLGGMVAGAVASTSILTTAQAGTPKTGKGKPMQKLDNKDFYKADGSFDADAGKEAFYEMMKYHNYPIVDRLRSEDFWTLDFGLGKYTEVGMAGIFWINRKEDDYFGHEIYLLPGQMIPEHKHVKTPDARPKMEAWQPRHGLIYTYAEGAPNAGDEDRIPASHKECANARSAKKLMPGEVNWLAGPEEWHFMLAGPEGAIVTEYASYHDGAALRFSHPKVSM